MRLCLGNKYSYSDYFLPEINNNSEFNKFAIENILFHKTIEQLIEIHKKWDNSGLHNIIIGLFAKTDSINQLDTNYIVDNYILLIDLYAIRKTEILQILSQKTDELVFDSDNPNHLRFIRDSIERQDQSFYQIQQSEYERLSSAEPTLEDHISHHGSDLITLDSILVNLEYEIPKNWSKIIDDFIENILTDEYEVKPTHRLINLASHKFNTSDPTPYALKIKNKISELKNLSWMQLQLLFVPVIKHKKTIKNRARFVNIILSGFIKEDGFQDYMIEHKRFFAPMLRKAEKNGDGQFKTEYIESLGEESYAELIAKVQ